MATLSPLVYWSQSKKNLLIKINLINVKGPTIKLEKTTLQFESKADGPGGPQNYGFSLEFYSKIITEETTCKIEEGKVCFNIAKEKESLWPRLITNVQTPTWLKQDLDQPLSEDKLPQLNIKAKEINSTKEKLTKIYLITYNLLLFFCYLYVVAIMVGRFVQGGTSFSTTFAAVGTTIKYLHILQLSEILLAAIGVTSGDFITLLMQLFARLVLIFTIIDAEPKLHTEPVVCYVYFIWAVVELIRYPFYITQICKTDVFVITWLRYTIWIFSLSLGAITEFITIYKSLLFLDDASVIPKLYRLLLLISLPPLICNTAYHMYQARKKKFGPKRLSKLKSN